MVAITDIYFHQNNEKERQAALELNDAVLRLTRDGAFVVVPRPKVSFEPKGPHPVGMDLASAL
jgi:DOPA 4,5-dioxygenase